MRPGEKGIFTVCPAFFAASSMAASPPRTMRSAREIFFPLLPLDCALLNSFWIASELRQNLRELGGLVHIPILLRGERMRAPLAPPRLSEPRNDAADAQAVVTSWEIVSPEARILALRAATSCSPINL